MEQDLEIGQVVYLREIPNMQGHCVVLRNGKPPLVGYHLDRFELLGKDGVVGKIVLVCNEWSNRANL